MAKKAANKWLQWTPKSSARSSLHFLPPLSQDVSDYKHKERNMENKIHPLQESTVHLLGDLYRDKNLPVTPAMLSVLNGHYPTVDAILATLQRYANETIVAEFISRNSDLIEKTKNEIREQKEQQEQTHESDDVTIVEEDTWPSFEFINPYEVMKSVSLAAIEESFSQKLSELCDEELVVQIDSVEGVGSSYDCTAELKVTVKSKSKFR